MVPFVNFIRSYVSISDDHVNKITQFAKETTLPKGRLLFRRGQVCEEFIFITKGCLRFFYCPQEIEISVWFAFPNTVGSEVQSFISGQPCRFDVQAIYPVHYISIPKKAFQQLREEIPAFNNFYIQLCEETITYIIDRLIAFQSQTADQRYKELLQQPEFMKLIPQKYLASYLGITPTSLSRLRKQIASV
jgi:CRP-like cAMP-binding protein